MSAVPTPVNGFRIAVLPASPFDSSTHPNHLTYPTHPTYVTHPDLTHPEHIPHCVPTPLAANPGGGGQGSARKRGAIARHVRQRDRLSRTVEADDVRAGN